MYFIFMRFILLKLYALANEAKDFTDFSTKIYCLYIHNICDIMIYYDIYTYIYNAWPTLCIPGYIIIYSIQILFFMANIILYKSKFIFYWHIFNVFIKNTLIICKIFDLKTCLINIKKKLVTTTRKNKEVFKRLVFYYIRNNNKNVFLICIYIYM